MAQAAEAAPQPSSLSPWASSLPPSRPQPSPALPPAPPISRPHTAASPHSGTDDPCPRLLIRQDPVGSPEQLSTSTGHLASSAILRFALLASSHRLRLLFRVRHCLTHPPRLPSTAGTILRRTTFIRTRFVASASPPMYHPDAFAQLRPPAAAALSQPTLFHEPDVPPLACLPRRPPVY